MTATASRRTRSKTDFPLMAWNTEIPGQLKLLKRVRACGLTMAGFGDASVLENCRKAGLTMIVQDPLFFGLDWRSFDPVPVRSAIRRRVRQLMRHKGLGGYYLMDEPGAALFPGLGRMTELIREIDPDHWIYINLLPNYATPEQLGTPSYVDYLESFIKHCRPQALSYDNYFLTRDNPSDYELFWSNLRIVSDTAFKHGIPFWNIVSSVGSYSYRVPTDIDLRLQAFASLAYGAGGVAYFTYFAPPHGNYRLSPVDQFNNETPTWYHLQNVNLQIQKIAPVLLRLSWRNAYHLGPVPTGCRGLDADSLVSDSPTGPLLIGEFTAADGTFYVMLVNPDMAHSIFCIPKIRAGLKVGALVSTYTGDETPYYDHQAFLAPGQGALLRLAPA